jgi:hypothetical protein
MYTDADSDEDIPEDIPLLTYLHCSSGGLCVLSTDCLPSLKGSSSGRILCMVAKKIALLSQIVSTKHSPTLVVCFQNLYLWDKSDTFCTEQDHLSKM